MRKSVLRSRKWIGSFCARPAILENVGQFCSLSYQDTEPEAALLYPCANFYDYSAVIGRMQASHRNRTSQKLCYRHKFPFIQRVSHLQHIHGLQSVTPRRSTVYISWEPELLCFERWLRLQRPMLLDWRPHVRWLLQEPYRGGDITRQSFPVCKPRHPLSLCLR